MALITETLKGIELTFETSPDVFSPRWIDRGTRAMLSIVEFAKDDRVLDLGCGYGVVGILAARLIGADRVVMIDSSAEAVRLTGSNNRRPPAPLLRSAGAHSPVKRGPRFSRKARMPSC